MMDVASTEGQELAAGSVPVSPPAGMTAADALAAAHRLLASARAALDDDRAAARRSLDQLSRLLTPHESASSDRLPARGGLAPWQLRRVRDFIAEHLDETLSIARLAEVARLSPSHFGRAFRASTGLCPHAYITRQRVERAKHLMMTTSDPISEIALACGMADQSHMSRLFIRLEGIAPGLWRRLNMKGAVLPKAA